VAGVADGVPGVAAGPDELAGPADGEGRAVAAGEDLTAAAGEELVPASKPGASPE
jgi:hypothetical protein